MKIISLRSVGLFLALAATLIFAANSGGPAANGNYYTGAPTAGGGVESTCSTCHRNGNFGEPAINVTLALQDDPDNPVTTGQYLPGRTYSVTVAVGFADNRPEGYGFQAQVLTAGESPVTAGTLTEPDEGTQISAGQGDRRYAEHRRRSTDSLFTFAWVAPAAGTDSVKMYVVGNLVDGSGTAGDNGSTAPTVITLAEQTATGNRNFSTLSGELFPNPSQGPVFLRVAPRVAGLYTLSLWSPEGRLLSRQRSRLAAGPTTLPLPTNNLTPGTYAVELRGAGARLVRRIVMR